MKCLECLEFGVPRVVESAGADDCFNGLEVDN